jgi:hypothetical protein
MIGKSGLVAVVLMITIAIVLSSIFDRGEQLFGIAPSNIIVKTATSKNISATWSSSLRKPTHANYIGTQLSGDVDELSELRPDGSIIFPGAREWYEYWSYASRKGKIQLKDDDNSHIHDDFVISSVETVSEATLQHINEMKARYDSVDALADFYARGLGWIMDVSLHLPCFVASSNSYPDVCS